MYIVNKPVYMTKPIECMGNKPDNMTTPVE